MLYDQKEPDVKLSAVIKRFWMADNQDDHTIRQQKIIPDGYPEIIFHYGDRYQIKMNKTWIDQSHFLVSGQIRNFFYLRNTGKAGMFAITLQPWALKKMFDLNMPKLLDKVVPFDAKLSGLLRPVSELASSSFSFDEKVQAIEKWFLIYIQDMDPTVPKGETATRFLLKKNGLVSIQEVLNKTNISERSLERYFKSHIGLSAKYYSRIIRLSYVFKLVSEEKINWADLAFLAGFYDQSHFIKNFKEFTGDEPSRYLFNEKNMANFFLQP